MMIRVAMFYQSLASDWNHGNAHFLRGIASELQARGNEVRIFEPRDGWSRTNLLREQGAHAIERFQQTFPHLASTTYSIDELCPDEWLDDVDLALVHEWNDPQLVAAIGHYRRRNGRLRLLFHDTHHRALTAEHELARFNLSAYDGVLAYGESLQQAYERRGWTKQVWVWHEAADARTFYPRVAQKQLGDVVWIGNWGDEERTEELREFFIDPVKRLGLKAHAYGVRYPHSAIEELRQAGIEYGGWIPNFEVPSIFAQFRMTLHVPRRPYTRELRGIPTIRVFEALACGIPLVSSPWEDCEGLFRGGEDFLMATDGNEMERHMRSILEDRFLAQSLAASGLETIRNRHTCRHRVDELLAIYDSIKPRTAEEKLAAVEVQA